MSKRVRRTKSQLAELDNRIVAILRDDHPQSVRHVFYRLVDDRSLDVPIPKTESGYRIVGERLRQLRWSGRVHWPWVADATRSCHYVTTYQNPSDFLSRTLGMYRLDEWAQAGCRVEVWCESRSLGGTLRPIWPIRQPIPCAPADTSQESQYTCCDESLATFSSSP